MFGRSSTAATLYQSELELFLPAAVLPVAEGAMPPGRFTSLEQS